MAEERTSPDKLSSDSTQAPTKLLKSFLKNYFIKKSKNLHVVYMKFFKYKTTGK